MANVKSYCGQKTILYVQIKKTKQLSTCKGRKPARTSYQPLKKDKKQIEMQLVDTL
jgi:hypothetical protein